MKLEQFTRNWMNKYWFSGELTSSALGQASYRACLTVCGGPRALRAMPARGVARRRGVRRSLSPSMAPRSHLHHKCRACARPRSEHPPRGELGWCTGELLPRQYIPSLKRHDGSWALKHEEKQLVLDEFFENLLGKKVRRQHWQQLQLTQLQQQPGLELDRPFTVDEIGAAVKELPNGKAPGPDGFTDDFYKHCWDIV